MTVTLTNWVEEKKKIKINKKLTLSQKCLNIDTKLSGIIY